MNVHCLYNVPRWVSQMSNFLLLKSILEEANVHYVGTPPVIWNTSLEALHGDQCWYAAGRAVGWSRQTRTFNKCVVHKHAVLNRPSLHCYWSGQPRGKECRPPRLPLGLPTEYYPFKRCQVPMGHPVYKVNKIHFESNLCILLFI